MEPNALDKLNLAIAPPGTKEALERVYSFVGNNVLRIEGDSRWLVLRADHMATPLQIRPYEMRKIFEKFMAVVKTGYSSGNALGPRQSDMNDHITIDASDPARVVSLYEQFMRFVVAGEQERIRMAKEWLLEYHQNEVKRLTADLEKDALEDEPSHDVIKY